MTEKPWTLRDHEVRQVLTTGECLVVRPVKPQPRDPRTNFHFSLDGVWLLERRGYENYAARSEDGMSITCPYPIGSRWWVRETWCPYADDMTREYCQTHDPEWGEPIKPAVYSADYDVDCNPLDVGGCEKWHSSITMPRWASRMDVEVVESTVEQQDGVWVWITKVRRVQ